MGQELGQKPEKTHNYYPNPPEVKIYIKCINKNYHVQAQITYLYKWCSKNKPGPVCSTAPPDILTGVHLLHLTAKKMLVLGRRGAAVIALQNLKDLQLLKGGEAECCTKISTRAEKGSTVGEAASKQTLCS